jgi:hypothetical protein
MTECSSNVWNSQEVKGYHQKGRPKQLQSAASWYPTKKDRTNVVDIWHFNTCYYLEHIVRDTNLFLTVFVDTKASDSVTLPWQCYLIRERQLSPSSFFPVCSLYLRAAYCVSPTFKLSSHLSCHVPDTHRLWLMTHRLFDMTSLSDSDSYGAGICSCIIMDWPSLWTVKINLMAGHYLSGVSYSISHVVV